MRSLLKKETKEPNDRLERVRQQLHEAILRDVTKSMAGRQQQEPSEGSQRMYRHVFILEFKCSCSQSVLHWVLLLLLL